jgi:hypothetical protein
MISKLCTLAALMALGGCSFGMRGPDPEWDGKQLPSCSDDHATVVLDGVMSGLVAATMAALPRANGPDIDGSVLLGGIGISVAYLAGALVGHSRYKSCRLVRADWYIREAIRKANAKSPVDVETLGEGYFCTNARARPDLNVCLHERKMCMHARPAPGLRDGGECIPHRFAWCFTLDGKPRCFAAETACKDHSAAMHPQASTCERAF